MGQTAEWKRKILPAADLSSVGALNLREKASYCRWLARAATDTDLVIALLELADEVEQAALDSIGPLDDSKSPGQVRSASIYHCRPVIGITIAAKTIDSVVRD